MCVLPDFFFSFVFSVQQTTNGIGHRVCKVVFRVSNQFAVCEKQQQKTVCCVETFRYTLSTVMLVAF